MRSMTCGSQGPSQSGRRHDGLGLRGGARQTNGSSSASGGAEANARAPAMRKALATIGSGPMKTVLHTAMPTYQRFAEIHGYEIVIGTGDSAGRPPEWGKIPLLRTLIDEYDVVLWMDADAIFIDYSVDPLTMVRDDAFQAMVDTPFSDRTQSSPCLGFWLLRSEPRSAKFLEAIWNAVEWTDHEWREQSAAMDLLGWTTEYPLEQARVTHWSEGTHWLDLAWDMIPSQDAGYSEGFVRHYARYPNWLRRRLMRIDLVLIRSAECGGFRRLAWSLSRWVRLQERRVLIRALVARRRWHRSRGQDPPAAPG